MKNNHFALSIFGKNEKYIDPEIHSIIYQQEYLKKKVQTGVTNDLRHDLLLAWYDDLGEQIPYRAFTIFGAKLMWLRMRIKGFLFQKQIINRIIKDLSC